MSSKDRSRFFTAICSLGEQRQIVQLEAVDQIEALAKWAPLMRHQERCILSLEQIGELERDFADGIIEPVACDGVISVWACSDLVNGKLIDLLFVATDEQ